MSVIEAELVKLFKFKKSPEDFFDRQDYLDAICQAMEKVKDDEVFDDMTEPTYDWLQEAVEAHNKKREIPDFPDAKPEEVEGDSEAEEAEVAEADPKVDEEAIEEELEEAEAADAEEAEAAAELDAELPDGEVEPAESPDVEGAEPSTDEIPAKKPRKKPVKAGKYIKKKMGKPDVEPKNKPGHEPDYRKVTGEKNRYGVTKGTKADMALKMFEKGCTMRDANIELGDNYYVILRRLVKQGHRVEKLENRVLKLIHKDDLQEGEGQMTVPFDLKAPMVTALSANVYADGVRLAFGENIPDSREATYHTAVFLPASLYPKFRKLITSMEPKLAEMKDAV